MDDLTLIAFFDELEKTSGLFSTVGNWTAKKAVPAIRGAAVNVASRPAVQSVMSGLMHGGPFDLTGGAMVAGHSLIPHATSAVTSAVKKVVPKIRPIQPGRLVPAPVR